MIKKAYSVETKLACIEIKKTGKSNKIIMETLGLKNNGQVKIWWRWYQNDELYRFHHPIGKQYTYGKGMKQLSEVEEYKKTCPVSIILECFGVKRSTFYRWKQECKSSQKRDEIADKIEKLSMENHFI